MASELIGERREGTASIKKQGANKLSFTSQWKFLVGTDSVDVQREEVLFNTPGLPIVGLVYGLINATCTSKSASRVKEASLYWEVTCDFDTAAEDQKQDPANPSDDPTTWIPVFVIDSFETKQRVLTLDKSPTPQTCTNSAKQQFSEPLIGSATLCSFSFTQFESSSLSLNTIMNRNDCVNSVAIAGFAERTLKINVTNAELGYYGNVSAWRITYRCTYDRDTWDEKRDDIGPNYKSGTALVPFQDLTNSFRVVGKLNGTGGKQTDQGAAPQVITFRTYTEIAFATFVRV